MQSRKLWDYTSENLYLVGLYRPVSIDYELFSWPCAFYLRDGGLPFRDATGTD